MLETFRYQDVLVIDDEIETEIKISIVGDSDKDVKEERIAEIKKKLEKFRYEEVLVIDDVIETEIKRYIVGDNDKDEQLKTSEEEVSEI